MSMWKQSPSKLRSKGFKVKNVVQICVLLVICLWYIHQIRHSNNEKKAIHEDVVISSEKELGGLKLGRKDLHAQADLEDLEKDGRREKALENPVENKAVEGQRGVGDDEIDGHDQEERAEDDESEELEDLIDEDDTDREDGSSDDLDNEEMDNQSDDESSSLREESSKADESDNALGALMQDDHTQRLFTL